MVLRSLSQLFVALLAIFGVSLAVVGQEAAAIAEEKFSPHPIVQALVTEGFEVADGELVPVAPPTLLPGMDAVAQRSALEELFGEVAWDDYFDRSVNARKLLDIDSADLELDGATVRKLDLVFVAYGKLAVVRDKDLMQSVFGGSRGGDETEAGFKRYAESLTAEETQARGFEQQLEGERRHHLTRYRFALIEKVVIEGLVEGDGRDFSRLLVESAVSPLKMLEDADYPSVWREIPRGAETDADLEDPEPFRGFAGYLQASELKFEPGALLVECHGVFVEPDGWFNGRNLLASKLPIVVQDNVRDFRRRLAKATEELKP